MKTFLKLTIALIMGIVAVGFQSCGGDDDEPEARIKVTQSEIQGKWHMTAYGTYHRFTFDGNEYSYSRMNNKTSKIEYMENGTYTISGYSIVFKSTIGTSQLGDCEIYWDNNLKNSLHIYPLGSYIKTN